MGTPRPIFARTRWSHIVYDDFWRLVALSKFETCFIDEVELDRDVFYIATALHQDEIAQVLNKKLSQGKPRRARIAGAELEPPGWYQCKPQNRKLLDYYWVMDRYITKQIPGSMHFVLGGHAGMREGNPIEPRRFDVCFLAAALGRRVPIWETLNRSSIQLGPPHFPKPAVPGQGIFGEERATLLNSCRTMLHVHQKGLQVKAPLRFALAAAYGLPLLSERIEDPWPLVPGKDFLMSPCVWTPPEGARRGSIHEMVPLIQKWLERPDLHDFAQALRQRLLVEWTFEAGIMDAVKRSLGG